MHHVRDSSPIRLLSWLNNGLKNPADEAVPSRGDDLGVDRHDLAAPSVHGPGFSLDHEIYDPARQVINGVPRRDVDDIRGRGHHNGHVGPDSLDA